jgi:transcriptional regulator NrdR family protein
MNNNDFDGQGPECPVCGGHVNTVVETRSHEAKTWRRRKCTLCDTRFTTVEVFATNAGIITALETATAFVHRNQNMAELKDILG